MFVFFVFFIFYLFGSLRDTCLVLIQVEQQQYWSKVSLRVSRGLCGWFFRTRRLGKEFVVTRLDWNYVMKNDLDQVWCLV